MSQDELQVLKEYIEEMMKHGKIQEGSGSNGSPVFFIKGSIGKPRLVTVVSMQLQLKMLTLFH